MRHKLQFFASRLIIVRVNQNRPTRRRNGNGNGKVGHPTDYNPAFCAIVVACMKEGWCREEVQMELNISHTTWHNWEEVHPEFAEALLTGDDYARAFRFKEWREKKTPANFMAGLKHLDGWVDKVEVDNQYSGTVNHKHAHEWDLDKLETTDLERLAHIARKAQRKSS